jgi:hypothetical protein
MNVSEENVLRRIFRTERVEETGGWRQLHDDDFMIYALHWILLG